MGESALLEELTSSPIVIMLPPAILERLGWLMTSLQLVNKECFNTLVVKGAVTDVPCLKMLLSRSLGTAIVAGSTMVKLPQILKIIGNGDAAGLSFLGVLLELLAVTANGAYSFSQGFPFSAYGESVFMSLQDLHLHSGHRGQGYGPDIYCLISCQRHHCSSSYLLLEHY